ncbi:hypothetical protein [Streptomyces sp. NL15-2K]|uniref:hypothetical protein n=1 Tax=Streptomyces sp. NL15-2K TaxID=376149 RepID=UPI000F568AD7|nr:MULTISPECIES: hypothetical protein [Actinomycetes]WKX15898.1 hypothetical protein Q4V64_53815 [Kutzneria buriramensis]GCB53446.1 hypothetical protein SNL152K_10803 [Streptomyces sp. NL15-2K]
MATINEVLAALTELRSDLETHAWQPDEYEHDLATAMRAEGGASAHAVRVGLRAAGPEVSRGRLAPVAARCAAILDSPTRATSQDGRELRLTLDDVLDLVVRATGDQLQTLGTVRRATP